MRKVTIAVIVAIIVIIAAIAGVLIWHFIVRNNNPPTDVHLTQTNSNLVLQWTAPQNEGNTGSLLYKIVITPEEGQPVTVDGISGTSHPFPFTTPGSYNVQVYAYTATQISAPGTATVTIPRSYNVINGSVIQLLPFNFDNNATIGALALCDCTNVIRQTLSNFPPYMAAFQPLSESNQIFSQWIVHVINPSGAIITLENSGMPGNFLTSYSGTQGIGNLPAQVATGAAYSGDMLWQYVVIGGTPDNPILSLQNVDGLYLNACNCGGQNVGFPNWIAGASAANTSTQQTHFTLLNVISTPPSNPTNINLIYQ